MAYSSDPEDLPTLDVASIWYEENPIPQIIVGSLVSFYGLKAILNAIFFSNNNFAGIHFIKEEDYYQ